MSAKFAQWLKQATPYLAMAMMQFGYAGSAIITKYALNQGMSTHVLVVYRCLVAAVVMSPFAFVLERKTRPKMTYSIFAKIVLLALLEPVTGVNFYYTGTKFTSATFTAAMTNVLPAFVFVLAWIFRLEKINPGRIHSQAKVSGTMLTVGGAMIMSLYKGPGLNLPWTNQTSHQDGYNSNNQITLKGCVMLSLGCVFWSMFIILQANTLKSYPAALSLTSLICIVGTAGGSVVALAFEWRNTSAWALHPNSTLVASLYTGIVTTGLAYFIEGKVMKAKGPVFVTAFNPLSTVIVAVLSSFVLSEIMHLGRVIGAIIVIVGLYLILWGKTRDKNMKNGNESTEIEGQDIATIDELVENQESESV